MLCIILIALVSCELATVIVLECYILIFIFSLLQFAIISSQPLFLHHFFSNLFVNDVLKLEVSKWQVTVSFFNLILPRWFFYTFICLNHILLLYFLMRHSHLLILFSHHTQWLLSTNPSFLSTSLRLKLTLQVLLLITA
jgi:hypothetical protein